MPDRVDIHTELGAYLLDALGPADRAAFETHLDNCPRCQAEATELREALALVDHRAEHHEPPPALEARTLEAVERAAREAAGSRTAVPRRRRRVLRVGLAGAVAALVAGAYLAGADRDPRGTFELAATLSAPHDPELEARATVRKVGEGRIIHLTTDDLPVLPPGSFYELWFVGPGDAPGRPNRISAGTFHPDEDGRSRVRLTAAVDPEQYPRIAVTREPGDGSPAPTLPDVLRSG